MFGTMRRRAQSMTEYIVIVGLIALLLIAAVRMFGKSVGDAYAGSTWAVEVHSDPPTASNTDSSGFKTGRSWTTDKGTTIKLKKTGDGWVPWAISENRAYNSAVDGSIRDE